MSSLRPTLDFLLYDWLKVDQLAGRERFTDHSRETFDAVLDTCERIAREKYAPFNRLVDTEEPRFDGEKVILPQATKDAWDAYAGSGMLSAAQDYAVGGMQLPYTVEAAAGRQADMDRDPFSGEIIRSGGRTGQDCQHACDGSHSRSSAHSIHIPPPTGSRSDTN